MKTAFALIALVALVAPAHAVDLDAPATKPVTIRSEVERGMAALDAQKVIASDPQVLTTRVEAIAAANKQANTDNWAFQYGLK